MATVVWYIYSYIKGSNATSPGAMGYAAAGAVILFIIIMILLVFKILSVKRKFISRGENMLVLLLCIIAFVIVTVLQKRNNHILERCKNGKTFTETVEESLRREKH